MKVVYLTELRGLFMDWGWLLMGGGLLLILVKGL